MSNLTPPTGRLETGKIQWSPAKAVAAGVGTVINSAAVFWAAVTVAAQDDAFDLGEFGTLSTAALTMIATVVAVFKTENKRVN